MSAKVKPNTRIIKSDFIERSVLIGMFLVLLSILSVDLISRDFHIKHAGDVKRLDNTEQVQKP